MGYPLIHLVLDCYWSVSHQLLSESCHIFSGGISPSLKEIKLVMQVAFHSFLQQESFLQHAYRPHIRIRTPIGSCTKNQNSYSHNFKTNSSKILIFSTQVHYLMIFHMMKRKIDLSRLKKKLMSLEVKLRIFQSK